MSKSKLEFRRLQVGDVLLYKSIRLEALQKHPENFTACYDQEKDRDDIYFANLLSDYVYMGCFREEKLLGVCGLMPEHASIKKSHCLRITGFYIRPDYRGRGFAKKLMSATMDSVEYSHEKIILDVGAKNRGAKKLYQSLGFEVMGYEKKSLRLEDGSYVDLLHMVKFLNK